MSIMTRFGTIRHVAAAPKGWLQKKLTPSKTLTARQLLNTAKQQPEYNTDVRPVALRSQEHPGRVEIRTGEDWVGRFNGAHNPAGKKAMFHLIEDILARTKRY